MEIQYHGADCVRITTKKSVILIDPKSDITEIKPDLKKVNAILATQEILVPSDTENIFVVSGPGEYEFEDYSVLGVAAQPHTASTGDNSATIYRIITGDTTVLVTGHINSKLSEEQLETIGTVDILVIAVGGNGYTLDATGAATLVRSIEPKMVIPVHSSDDGLKYEVAQNDVEAFVKELSAPVAEEKVDKLKIKTLPEQLIVQIINKS
jgi:L-ascorbate metabolism protein UlaG (beta-lactamase superfamily)